MDGPRARCCLLSPVAPLVLLATAAGAWLIPAHFSGADRTGDAVAITVGHHHPVRALLRLLA